MMEIYDISQIIREGIAVWPGDQKFRRQWNMRLEKGQSCNLSAITMSLHTGTHLDAPYHFDDAGPDIASVALKHYVGPARVVTMNVERCISAHDLVALSWDGVERVLFRTRPGDLSETRFDSRFVYLAEDAAGFLGERNMLLVGTDSPSVDAFDSKTLQTHKALLGHGTAILEGVRLGQVPDGDYELICLPLKLAGADGSPVRAILRR
jgi:arylformamidase